MTRRTSHIGAALVGAVAVAAGAGAADLEDVASVRMQGNAASQKSQQRIDRVADETDRVLAEYRQVQQQISSLRIYNRQLEKLVGSQEAELESLRDQIDNVTVIGRGVSPLMLRMIDALENFVALDVPFLPEERSARIENLRELMGRADVADSEKFRRLLEAYQIENEYGRTIEAYRGSLAIGGSAKTVDFLRVGRIALVYQTLDGRESGYWDTRNRKWLPLSSRFRTSIRQGLRIARKQAAPDMIQLPVASPEDAG